MKIAYTWFILANGYLVKPESYTDEYGDKYALEPYDTEYQAIKSLEIYTEPWDCPFKYQQFTLVKTYEYR